ncbi:retrovirus-related pol polyprotein from transposon TNT 1-94, partial [Tanacetum coccineum]
MSEQIPNQKKKILGGEQLTESSSKNVVKENPFIPSSLKYDHEMVPKSKDWVERHNPDSKLLNFNTGKILVPKSQAGASPSSEIMIRTYQDHSQRERPSLVPTEVKINDQDSKIDELTKLVQMLIDEKINSTKKIQESKFVNLQSESSKPKPLQKPKLKCELYHYTNHSTEDCYRILYCMKYKSKDHRTSDHDMYVALLKSSKNYKAQPYQHASPSKQILKAKAKPYPPCTHYGFKDHHPDDFQNYTECEICRSYDHFTIRYIREPIWYLDSGCSRSMTGVKSYLHKYVEQPCPKVVFGDNSSCITEGYGSISCGGIVFSKVAFVNGLKYNLISISQLCDAKYIVQFDDKQRTIFNANKEIVLIAPRRSDAYVLDMPSLTPNGSCFFAKALESVYFLRKKSQAVEMFMSFIRMVENQNDVKVKQIRIDNGTEFRNHELESFCDKKRISQNFSSPYTPEQDGVAERKNRTLIEAARTMLNGSVLSKHFWTKVVRITCYTQNISIIIKRHDKTPYEIFKKRILNISYFHMFGCLVFIHNYKDHLGKFNAKADDGYFLGYLFVSKAFRVFNARRQKVDETYHVTFYESTEAIRFTNTSVNETGIDDSSKYPPDEFLQEDDPSRQYQSNFDFSYYIIPRCHSLTELTKDTHVPEVITSNEQNTPHIEDVEVHEVSQSQIIHHASTSSHPAPQDRWLRDQHIELVNIIGEPTEGMLTRSMAVKLTVASTSECLFADFLSKIEPKKVYEAVKHPRWVDAMQEELNQFYRDKVWTLVSLLFGKIAIGSSQEEGIDYDESFAPVARTEATRIFFDFATYMNFIVFQMDVKSAFLNGKLKEEVYVKQPLSFESSEFPDYVCKLDKALYGLKQAPKA